MNRHPCSFRNLEGQQNRVIDDRVKPSTNKQEIVQLHRSQQSIQETLFYNDQLSDFAIPTCLLQNTVYDSLISSRPK